MFIEVDRLSKRFDNQSVLEEISFSVKRGECLGIIGPNGSGKSTLLKLLSGVESTTAGRIELKGKQIEQYNRKELAKWLAVLQQESLPPIGFTVREVIEMGRFPFQNWLGEETTDFERLIDVILNKMGLDDLSDRHLEYLSGGERQRVALGKTMAQQPELLMLDEPTTYLDIGHQVLLMDRIREWQLEEDLTVISVLHDLNLAALYCDRLLLLHNGRVVATGSPEDIIRTDLIEEVYGTVPIVMKHPVYGLPQIILQGESFAQRKGLAKKRQGKMEILQ
ncbi:heme ABC transporter ATP-binding protein [Cytobacillus praedii]|uniref:Heme ABC transporter ATP-binding protein n=1 Tax=Cytobacillus praedii TaxID=1742358 RepID=A0A4R1B0H8_9BACI|nr:heme ABC transporter ATP-binding protein [Cytobacillus praedii]MED3552830.1 heme ABC transporter ATP-binding protein [Cytobacillus praedii]TCJ03208.1 heme ABC transporter ATP-binding protein [Cytobacillus praedii]